MVLKDVFFRRLKVEENIFEFLFGNESLGEVYVKWWRLRGKWKSKDDLWFVLKCLENNVVVKESGVIRGGLFKGRMKDFEKFDFEIVGFVLKVKDNS